MIVEADRSDGGVYQCNATNKWGHDYSLIQLIVKGKWWCNDDSFCLSRDITCWSWSKTIIERELSSKTLPLILRFLSLPHYRRLSCLLFPFDSGVCFSLLPVSQFLMLHDFESFPSSHKGSISCDSLEFSLNDLSPPSSSCISFLREKRRETTLCVHLVLCLASGLVCLRFLISVFSSFFFLVLPSLSSI